MEKEQKRMADRNTTKRMYTRMVNMMEKHDTMTISCGDPLMKLLKDVRELLKEQDCNCCGTMFDVAYKAGKADAVIRCKDCRFFTEPDSHGDQCAKIHWSRGADWYCADGERKESR